MKLLKHTLLGLPINSISKSDLLNEIERRIDGRIITIIYGLCVGSLSRIKKKKKNLPVLLKQMDIIVPDGSAIPLFGKIFNVPVKETIPITELALELISLANKKKLKVLLFGTKQKYNDMAVENLKKRFPDAIIPKGINGFYKTEEEQAIVNKINEIKPDILLLGMTYPFKEEFSVKYKDKLSVPIILPCGGAIDVFAGITKRPPRLIKKLMLTWLYRWIQEPGRLKIKDDLRFLFITFPILLFKHIFIEKNPSLIKHYKLEL